MAFGVALAAALSGASPGQLEHWRRTPGRGRPVLVPEISAVRPLLYSFRDVVALRTCVYLRENVSLQKIRRAIAALNQLGFADHLSRYRLVATDDSHLALAGVNPSRYRLVAADESLALVEGDGAMDLVRHLGQRVIAEMSDVLASFVASKRAIEVPDFFRPRPKLAVDAAVRGGHPVVTGTRMPYDLVAGLVSDGVPPRRVRDFYPSVSAGAARDAHDFARYVEQVGRAA